MSLAVESSVPTGADTMSSELRFATNYHRWTNDWIRTQVTGRVLDIGGGTGNHLSLLEGSDLVSIDVSKDCVDELRARYVDRRNWSFEVADITDAAIVARLGRGSFDTVLSSNVFEHIRDDAKAFANAKELLRPGGHLVLVLPAHQSLFGSMDRLAGHYRRYDRSTVRQRLQSAGLAEVKLRYVNIVGAVGWFVNNRLAHHRDLSSRPINGQIRLFDRWLVPMLRVIEGDRAMPFGQSLVCVARRSCETTTPGPTGEAER